MAFSKLFGEPIDIAYRKNGDEQDNLIGGKYKVDVKCAASDYDKGLIYYINEFGKKHDLNKDIYVFCYVEEEDRVNKKAKIIIMGFCLKKHVLEHGKIKRGIKGAGHYNYEVRYSNLLPITKFLKIKKTRYGVMSNNQ